MINKVIIAEDHESANLSIEKTIEEFKVEQHEYVFYCDDAYNKIQLAIQKGEPYDLLITDLTFEADGTSQKLSNGYDLIRTVRAIQPGIMILVFTGEDRPANISKLYKQYEVDGYVRKARHDIKELKQAFESLAGGNTYYPYGVLQLIRQTNSYVFKDFDITIISLLARGYRQKEIEIYLKENKIEPCSLSSIEKRLKDIRNEFGFSKNEQLVLFCKDKGIL